MSVASLLTRCVPRPLTFVTWNRNSGLVTAHVVESFILQGCLQGQCGQLEASGCNMHLASQLPSRRLCMHMRSGGQQRDAQRRLLAGSAGARWIHSARQRPAAQLPQGPL